MENDILVIAVVIGFLIWMGIYTIVARICSCFEICSMYKSVKDWQDLVSKKTKKVTVEDLYPKENREDE